MEDIHSPFYILQEKIVDYYIALILKQKGENKGDSEPTS